MAAQSVSKLFLALTLVTLYSCSKQEIAEEVHPGGCDRINATISESTKTSLDGLNVCWGKDDRIEIFTQSDVLPSVFTLESGAGTSSATFSGALYASPVFAKYPFSTDDRYEDGFISTDLPDKQTYVPGSFSSDASPMAAIPDAEGNVCFRNLCSVLRLSLTGTAELTEIIVTSDDSTCYFAGPAKIRLVEGVPTLTIEPLNTKATIHTVGDGYTSVHLDCSSVRLSQMIPSTFCIVVPSQVYEKGITIEVCTKLGNYTKHTGVLDLKSSTLYDIEPFEVKINGGVEPSTFLVGKGTSDSPFQISSVSDLLYIKSVMASKGNLTNEDGSVSKASMSAWFEFTSDIDLSGCCGEELGSWEPLTVNRNWFTGHIEGNGHKVTGLYVKSGTDGRKSFIGDLYTGGYIGNLEVSGNTCGEYAGIVCSSNYGTIENCIAHGTVYSTNASGGVAAHNYGTMKGCINYADVTNESQIYTNAGGIASSSIGGSFSDCINYGKITASSGNCHAGGITGSIQESVIFNCANYGNVTGAYHSAGIVGTAFDTDIANCANYGDVYGANNSLTLCGGICGELRDPFSAKTGTVKNCISTGNVSGGKKNGGICGSNVRIVQYCYWLYDGTQGVSTGVNGGTTTGISALTVSQMKGQSASPSLYGGYTNPVDALNSYGFENSSSDASLYGWMYDSSTGWPVMTGRPALPPGQADKFIKASPTSFTLNTYKQNIELSVASSSDVSISLPEWISTSDVKTEKNGVILYTTYTLEVQQNKSGSERTAELTVSGADGCSCSVSVTQRYTYVSEDYSRNGNVVTLQKASEGAGIDIILFGDAYTDADIKSGKYETDMKRGVDAFFSVEPYASFRNLFNVYYMEIVSSSNEIGSSTAFSSYFGDGTLVGGNDSKVRSLCNQITLKSSLDDVTAIVIVNTKRYAGTCYMYYTTNGTYGLGFSISYFPLGTSTTGQTSMEALIRHEAGGHGFGKLADEYSYQSMGTIPEAEINSYRNYQEYGWWPNVDFTSDAFSVRWSKYIQDNRYASEEINVYEGGATYWSGVWRPTMNSIMRYNTGRFNAPSREAIYTKIHKLAYGESWTFDYETFVKYDAVNRSAAALKANAAPSAAEVAGFRPTHPPVIVEEW